MAITVDNVQAILQVNVPDASVEIMREFAIQGIVSLKRISYLVDTVRSFLAKRFRAIQKQAFSVRYGSSGRPIRENINCNCRIELIYKST